MEYLRVGFAIVIGIALFAGWCLRPRPRGLNDVPPERAMDEARVALVFHGGTILLIVGLLAGAAQGLIDRDTLLARGSDREAVGYVFAAWTYLTFYALLIARRILLGPEPK